MTVSDIYRVIDTFAPFSSQDKWDNSGLLVGEPDSPADRILVALDISLDAIERARMLECDLIISHHPIIFDPLKKLEPRTPVYELCRSGISAICTHTPMDKASGGINDMIVNKLRGTIQFAPQVERLTEDGTGRIITFPEFMKVTDVANAAKKALDCPYVRFSKDIGDPWIRRLGICSGSGASLLEEVADRCDGLLTGDVKHDRWYKAEDLGVALIDCGHFETEVIMVPYLAEILRRSVPGIEIFTFTESPVEYV